MLTIDRYLRPATLQEAYEAVQGKNSAVLGGMLWLRLGKRRIGTAIDLSDLGLRGIEDRGDHFCIGAYTTLRDLETDPALEAAYGGAIRESVCAIVGVQFRNMATVGGSLFGRFGFSDVLTTLMALGARVELYRGGTVTLEEFCTMGRVRDILTHVILPKRGYGVAYAAHRNAATDFPALNVCVARGEEGWRVVVGARPLRGVLCVLPAELTPNELADAVAVQTEFASNSRASADYRRHLCRVLCRRAAARILNGKERG